MHIAASRTVLFSAVSLILLSACGTAPEKPAETAAAQPQAAVEQKPRVNDFSTQERVEYVLECVAKKGGLKYETLYPCICKADKLAEKMTASEYDEAKTFTYLRKNPGDQGGIFRDPPQAKKLRDKLKEAEDYAEKRCFVRNPGAAAKTSK